MLICDMWHPEIDVDRDMVPTLTEQERAVLAAARAGQHQPVTERHYTVGKSEKRGSA